MNMKRVPLILVILFLCINIVSAQNKNITTANVAIEQQQLKKAKTAIDQATKHEDTKGLSKTWKTRGDVYLNIHRDVLKQFSDLDKKALEKSYKAYQKAIELGNKEMAAKAAKKGKEPKPYREEKKILEIYKEISELFKQKGIDYYNLKDTESSVKYLKMGLQIDKMPHINKVDTVHTYYIAILANSIDDDKTALEYFNKVAALNYGVDEVTKDTITGVETKSSATAAEIHFQRGRLLMKKGDTIQAVGIYENSVKLFQKEASKSLTHLINYYLVTNQSEQAKKYLNDALAEEPNNATYHFAMGVLYDQTASDLEGEEREKSLNLAIKYYENTIKNNSEFADALYNLAAIYFNMGVNDNTKASALPFKSGKANPEYDKLVAQSTEWYKKAMPYFESYHKLKPDELKAINTLITIYNKTGNKEGVDEMVKKRDALR